MPHNALHELSDVFMSSFLSVVPCDGASPDMVYFDDTTGLIEVIGVPIPERSLPDQASTVRDQLETMLSEWERFSNAEVAAFDL